MATTETIDTITSGQLNRKSLLRKILPLLLAKIRERDAVRRSRRALERLNENDLRDIGLTRGQALAEYRKSHFID